MASAANKDVVKQVEINGQTILKILQHCNEALPQLVTGQLLGLDVGQTLEVTDCFPFPASVATEDGEDDAAGASYQLDMMRCLREVNVDNNTVGWYQSATMGTFQTAELIETFVNYHENIKKCVCIIYDPQRSQRGALALRAIRLKDSFIELYKQDKMTAKELREAAISWKDVFVDIPIKVANSSLTQALIAELEPDNVSTAGDVDRLNLSVQPFLEKNIQSLIDCVDDMINEQQKVTMYHKNVARQAQQQAAWLAKRRQENQARRAAGEELLPEEDPTLFKPMPEPSLLDTYLITSQISTYADQLNLAATQTLEKLYVVESLQKAI
uniref:Eukaryotic translation initiation factor 3 subunit H n=1 Tax=Chlamydomonas leiostraca TaxID=1034604 RepID=A0A7S0X132_9CHLO|mmetsp:Transcript_7345/g.18223  ORF Transcript_7345/g.18223 Transcript_7345/m.18223 type:complete len:327 (+) Transcript_7345:72-1052(+)